MANMGRPSCGEIDPRVQTTLQLLTWITVSIVRAWDWAEVKAGPRKASSWGLVPVGWFSGLCYQSSPAPPSSFRI